MSRCTAKSKRTGEQCQRPACKGKRVCYHHGGAPGSGRPIVTGRYSHFFAPDDHEGRAAYEAFRDDPHLEELANEVAILRAKFSQYQKRNSKAIDGRTVAVFLSFLDGIGKLVEKRHKIKYGEQVTITVREWEALSTRVLEMVRETYGDNDTYAAFLTKVERLYSAASGGQS